MRGGEVRDGLGNQRFSLAVCNSTGWILKKTECWLASGKAEIGRAEREAEDLHMLDVWLWNVTVGQEHSGWMLVEMHSWDRAS